MMFKIWLLLLFGAFPAAVSSLELPNVAGLKSYKPLFLYGSKLLFPKVHYELTFSYDQQHVNRLEFDPAPIGPTKGWQKFTGGQITIANSSKLAPHRFEAEGTFYGPLNEFTGIVRIAGKPTWFFEPIPAHVKQHHCCQVFNTIFYTRQDKTGDLDQVIRRPSHRISDKSANLLVDSESPGTGLTIINSKEDRK